MTEEPINPEAFVEQTAAIVGLSIQPEHRSGVVDNVARIITIAHLVMEFSLPEDIEIGPEFEP